MAFCVTLNFFSCIRRTKFPIDVTKAFVVVQECTRSCLGNLEFFNPDHVRSFVDCVDMRIEKSPPHM
jgi:hypothetical protein